LIKLSKIKSVLIKIYRIFMIHMMTKYLLSSLLSRNLLCLQLQKLYIFFSFINAQVKLKQHCHLFLYQRHTYLIYKIYAN